MTDSFRAAVLDALPQSALDLLPAALFFTSVPAGVILRCNNRALELRGPFRAERLRDLLRSTEGAADRIDPLATALEGAAPLRDAEGILETAGGPVPVSISIQPLPDRDGHVAAALTVCQPISRWKETERSLRRSEQWLMHALSAGRLGAWGFNLVTRSLTAAILTAVRLLQLKGPPDPELQRLRETVGRQTTQLTALVDGLLDVGRTAGREVVITVRDEGVGIARDMLERIFERYVQVRSSQHRAEGGLGIGLSLVKALVELHDGHGEGRSEGVGKGSEFVVRLPAAE